MAFRNLLKSNPGIVRLIANENNQPMAFFLCQGKSVPHQRKTYSQTLPFGMNRQRSQQKHVRSRLPNLERPEGNGAYKSKIAFSNHERQALDRKVPLAEPVGCLRVAGQTERQIEQILDGVRIGV
jgi:hypothetical protein